MMTTNQLSAATGRNPVWLRRKVNAGLCRKVGRDWMWDERAVQHFLALPETRGRKKHGKV